MRSHLLLMAVLSGVLWGATGIFVRVLSNEGMDSTTIVFSRVLFASFMMLAVILAADRTILRIGVGDLPLFLGCGITMILLNVLYTVSVDKLTLSLAAVLLSMSPAFMLIMAAAFFGERITGRKVACMLVSVLGCAMMSGVFEGDGTISVSGISAGIAAAFFYALYGLLSKKASSKGYSVYTTLFYCLAISTIMLLPFSDLGAVAGYGSRGMEEAAFLLLNSLLASVLPYIFYTIAVTRGEAGTGSILAACGEPLAAAMFGAMFFQEIPTVLTLTGFALAIGAMAVMCMPGGNGKEMKEEQSRL